MNPLPFPRPTVTHIGRSTIQNTPVFALSPEAIRNALARMLPVTEDHAVAQERGSA